MNKETQQRLRAIWTPARQRIEDALPEVIALMEAKFAVVRTPIPDSNLDQNGLRNGAEIVADFLKHNELGLALEHLCYMVKEAELPISPQTYSALEAAGGIMQMDAGIWQPLHALVRQP